MMQPALGKFNRPGCRGQWNLVDAIGLCASSACLGSSGTPGVSRLANANSWTAREPDGPWFGERRPHPASLGEAREHFLAPGGVAEPERDPPVEIHPLELDEG